METCGIAQLSIHKTFLIRDMCLRKTNKQNKKIRIKYKRWIKKKIKGRAGCCVFLLFLWVNSEKEEKKREGGIQHMQQREIKTRDDQTYSKKPHFASNK
jgi:hypothetical protein